MAFNWFKKKKDDAAAPEAADPNETQDPETESSGLMAEDAPPEDIAETTVPETEDTATAPDVSLDATEAEEATSAETQPQDVSQNGGLFARLKSGLSKTRQILTTDIDDLFLGKKLVDGRHARGTRGTADHIRYGRSDHHGDHGTDLEKTFPHRRPR